MNMKIFALPLLTLGLCANGIFAMEYEENAHRIQELRGKSPGVGAEDAYIWEELLRIDPNVTIGDLQSSIHSLNHKRNQQFGFGIPYEAHEEDLVKSASGYNACKRYLDLANHTPDTNFLSTVMTVIGSYLSDCTQLKKYDEAYQAALLMLGTCKENLDNYEIITEIEDRTVINATMYGLVQAFSHYEHVEHQKLQDFESFLKSKGETASRYLIDLYRNRKMHEQLVSFYSVNYVVLLNLPSVRTHLSGILLSCLFCKEVNLAQQILPLITHPMAKYTSQVLIKMVMDDQHKVLASLEKFEGFLAENRDQMYPGRQIYCDFIIKLLKKDINGAIAVFTNIPVGPPPLDRPTFANLIDLKERAGASSIGIQAMKEEYQAIFREPHSTHHREDLGSMIDIVLSS